MKSFHLSHTRTVLSCLTLCLFLTFTSSALAADQYVSIKNNGVNVRSGPSTDAPISWEVFKGFPLKVLKKENNWANCLDFEGDTGWVHEDLLTAQKTVIVKKKKINLRDDPETGNDSLVIALVKYGVVFDVIAKKGDWLKVRHEDSTEGWVHKDLVWPSDPLD